MLLDPAYVVENLAAVLLVVLLVAAGKALIFGGLTRLFRYGNVVPIAVGLGLFQVGEFSFVLARVGATEGVLTPELNSLILSVAIVTMLLTPPAARLVEPLYRLRRRRFRFEEMNTVNLPQTGLREHVVIVGHGRVGQFVADVLQRLGLQFVVIELDQRRMERAREAGFPVIFGDATQETVLEAAHLTNGRLLLVTVPAVEVTQAVLRTVRRLCPELHVVARAEGLDQLRMLQELGIYEVVQPESEAGLEITRQALLHLDVGPMEIQRFVDSVRRELYTPLFEEHAEYEMLSRLHSAQHLMPVHWLQLPADSPLTGRTIGEARIRTLTGASVVGLLRGDDLIANPTPDERLMAGDHLAVFGEHEELALFEQLAGDALDWTNL
jgi:CPA2 family monovalent cation:H+ antiporter-2